jgi:hypothetical protein
LGGQRYDTDLITRQLEALSRWDRSSANLRDVLDRKDLRHAPHMTLEVIERRLREDRGPAPLIPLPYPKDDGTTRRTCLLDPFDDLRLALLASAAAPWVNRALPPPGVVLSTRFLPLGPRVFYAEDWRDAKKRKGQVVRRVRNHALGGFDVEHHYPTVTIDLLVRLMNSIGVQPGLIDKIGSVLEGFAAWPVSPRGLPVGPMASALFGTLALLPVDRLLHRLAIVYERWVDDFVVVAHDADAFDSILCAVDEQLLSGGQRLNKAKTWYEGPRQSTSSLDDVDFVFDDDGREASLAVLARAVEARAAKDCRFVLGGLRFRANPEAAQFVAENDGVWELAPKHSAEYLISCRSDLTEDDVDALGERCTRSPTDVTAAGVAHCARVLATRRVRASLGPPLHEAADRSASTPFRAVSPTLYRAASVSKERASVRHTRSLDTAASLNDLNAQRGLLDGVAVDTPAKTVVAALRALERSNRDLAPTIAWVRSRQRI